MKSLVAWRKYQRLFSLFGSLSLALSLSACALPTSSKTLITISGRVMTAQGEPMPGKDLKLIIPPEYGLNDIDKEHGTEEDYSPVSHQVSLTTDALGSFSHTFEPIRYSQAMWIIPPLGSFPRLAPAPHFYLSFTENPQQQYSILVKEDQTLYGIYKTHGALAEAASSRPARISGKLLKDKRGKMKGWIADIEFVFNPEQQRAKFR